MASPQTEAGFVMIALDLFAAICAADLSNRCMIVLAEVLLQSYGPHKRRDVHLDPPTVEHYSGMHRNNVRRAIRDLCEASILSANTDGSYRFVKDFDSWTPGRRPLRERLEGGVARFIGSAIPRFRSNKLSVNVPIQPDIVSTSDPIQRDSLLQESQNPTGLSLTDVTESNGIVAHRGSRASEELETLEKRELREPAPTTATSLGDVAGEAAAGGQKELPALGEIRKLQGIAEQAFPGYTGEQFGRTIVSQALDIGMELGRDLECYSAAIDKAARHSKPIKDLHAFCLTLARRYRDKGIPPEPVAAEPSASISKAEALRQKQKAGFARKAAEEKARHGQS